MRSVQTVREADATAEPAPDGSTVRPLLALPGLGGMATFELPAGSVSLAVRHQSVNEMWYVLSGAGELWRLTALSGTVVPLEVGVCASIPAGTPFQFRAAAAGPLRIVAVTLPPWPGPHEAEPVPGRW